MPGCSREGCGHCHCRRAVRWASVKAAPDLVVTNDGDLGYARITFDEQSWQALAAAALEVDDPVTEAVCWTLPGSW